MPKVFEFKEWFAEMIEGSDISPEDAKVLLKGLERDEIRKNIGNAVLRQSDYSRRSDALATRETTLSEGEASVEKRRIDAEVFIKRQEDRDHNNETLHKQIVADLADRTRRLEELGEEVTSSNRETREVNDDSSRKYVTSDDLKKLKEEGALREEQSIAYSNRVVNLGNRFHKDFKEYLDPDILVKHATEKSMTLDDAYDDLYKERYDTKTEAEVQSRIDEAVEEARVEERSKKGFPEVGEGPQRTSVFDIPQEDRLQDEDSRVGAAVNALKEHQSGKRELRPTF